MRHLWGYLNLLPIICLILKKKKKKFNITTKKVWINLWELHGVHNLIEVIFSWTEQKLQSFLKYHVFFWCKCKFLEWCHHYMGLDGDIFFYTSSSLKPLKLNMAWIFVEWVFTKFVFIWLSDYLETNGFWQSLCLLCLSGYIQTNGFLQNLCLFDYQGYIETLKQNILQPNLHMNGHLIVIYPVCGFFGSEIHEVCSEWTSNCYWMSSEQIYSHNITWSS